MTRASATRPRFRVHLFEFLILLQLAALHGLLYAKGLGLRLAAIPGTVLVALGMVFPLFLAGVVLRLGYAALRGRGRSYLRRIRTRSWIVLSLRLVLSGALVMYFYSSLKGLLQVIHPALYDEVLWEIDRWTFLGFSPNVFALYALRHPAALRFFDVTYGAVFAYTLAASIPFFFSLASDRLRLSFATGSTLLWTAGAWLYFLVPSLGPCYVYAEVWEPFAAAMPKTADMQRFLMANYQVIQRIPWRSLPPEMNVLGGVAAFPSMHVGSQAFIALWVATLVRPARLAAHFSVALIFVGSVVTGWHYLVDSIAGALLAWLCFRLGWTYYGLGRWRPHWTYPRLRNCSIGDTVSSGDDASPLSRSGQPSQRS